ncbi:hypothetical protein HID58_094771, partial [Brassica napus]
VKQQKMLESLCPLLQLLQMALLSRSLMKSSCQASEAGDVIAASASAPCHPFSESTQYFDWLNLEKTYRELSPAEQQYFVTASLAGHFE